jgi:hypothetical protein
MGQRSGARLESDPIISRVGSSARTHTEPVGQLEASAFPQGYPLLWISGVLPEVETQAER